MNIIRYDGTRFITEAEIDQEFYRHWVLVSTDDGLSREGYLIASADGQHDAHYAELEDIAVVEYDSKATIIYGWRDRGGSMHVELLG